MELIKLGSHEALVTEISDEVANLAAFLEIPYNIQSGDDHIYIREASPPLALNTFYIRRKNDVMVIPKVFCNILMDIKGGLTVLEAYQKQGYTFDF